MTYDDHKSVKDIIQYIVYNNMKKLYLDISTLKFIDSLSVCIIIIISEKLSEINGSMHIINANDQVFITIANSKILITIVVRIN